MRLWVMSDLHVELTRGWDLAPPARRPDFDVLIMAGDLIPRGERGVRWLVERVPDKPVIYVMGNHEAYGVNETRTVDKAMEAARSTKIHVLQNRAISLGFVSFAGATLWTDFMLHGEQRRAIAIAGERMNDFEKIRTDRYKRRFRPTDALFSHQHSRAFLEAEMCKPRGSQKLVIVTHHAPVPDTKHSHDSTQLSDEEILTAAYRSDLTALMGPQPIGKENTLRPADVWIFGHTHECLDKTFGKTRVVSNAKGYGPWLPTQRAWENPNFDPNLVIEI